MKSYTKELWFCTKQEREFVNITPTVEQCLEESGIQEGGETAYRLSGQCHAHYSKRLYQR
jgi:thiamine phosphate synthase YjbQ (UPF0047 family)